MDLANLGQNLTGQDWTGEQVIAAIVIVVVGCVLAWLLGRYRRRLIEGFDSQSIQQLISLAVRVAQMLVIAVFVGWALARLGASVGWLTLVLIAAAILMALAARPIVEGLGAGAAIATRPGFKVGDEIEVDDIVGEITDITSRSTVILRRDGKEVHIPNVGMLGKSVTVYTAAEERRSAVDLTVGFDTDLDLAREAIISKLTGVKGIHRVGSIRTKIVDTGVGLSIRFWHPPTIQEGNDAIDAAVPAILEALADAGIGIQPPRDISVVAEQPQASN